MNGRHPQDFVVELSPRAIVIFCGLLMTVGAFSIDSTLPTFPFIVADFATDWDNAQRTVSVFMLTAGLSQLVVGTLSDRFGRRIVIQGGLLVYLAGAAMAAAAPSIELLLIGRALQGVGAGTGWVLARAILRDLFAGKELARNMALSTAVFAFGPIVAPLVSAGLILLFPWRSVFVWMIVFAAVLLAVSMSRLPETLARRDLASLRPAALAANARALFANRQSRHFLLLAGVSHTMMFLIIVGLPRVYEFNFGISGPLFAAYFAAHGFGIVIGQIANRRLIHRYETLFATRLAAGVLLAVALCVVAVGASGFANAINVTALFVGFATCYLIVYANAAALTLDPHGDIAGFASSFFGFFSQTVAAIGVTILAPLVGGDLIGFGAALSVLAAVVLAFLLAFRTGDAYRYAK
jgi:DHA1 family bicyclomycin/chloramphenicol resistance-like MFS transporter